MSVDDADQLQALLEKGGREAWPIPSERAVIRSLQEWGAFMESNSVILQRLDDWQAGVDQHLRYIVDPLPERIAQAFSDLIFGAETDFETPAQESTVNGRTIQHPGPDQQLLDEIVEDNSLPSELQAACARCVGEGEVWWRIYVDRDAFEHPVIEWHSRANVVPLYRGKKLLAAAFISDLSTLLPDAQVVDQPLRVGDSSDPVGQVAWLEQTGSITSDGTVLRYVNIHSGGYTRNLLYKGTRTTLGERVPLSASAQTADLPDEWQHGLDAPSKIGDPVPVMLAGRVTNGGTAGRLGRSQYAGVRWLLYELNKVRSIGSRNAELTMQKRAVLSSDVLDALTRVRDDATGQPSQATLPDAFVAPRDQMGDSNPMGVLEFSDAWADALINWLGELTDTILTRCRVAPQLVGRHVDAAHTGPALRARLLDSVLAADGKARAWDDELPKALRAAQLVDALPEEQGGCGHDWSAPDELPTVVRSSVLPEDETEEVNRHVAATAGRIESRRTAIQRLNPGFDDDRVDQELALIDADTPPAPVVLPRPQGPGLGVTPAGGNGAGR